MPDRAIRRRSKAPRGSITAAPLCNAGVRVGLPSVSLTLIVVVVQAEDTAWGMDALLSQKSSVKASPYELMMWSLA